MAMRCCTDSVTWAERGLHAAPTEGLEIPCRWCSGYARYEGGGMRYVRFLITPSSPTISAR